MDYSIGSLSDLITGSVTPNKLKVVKKQIELQHEDTTPEKPVQKKNKHLHNVKIDHNQRIDGDDLENVDKKHPFEIAQKLAGEQKEPIKKKSKNSKNAERRLLLKDKPKKVEEDPELLARTIFVGNLPISTSSKKLKKLFTKFGPIESVRFRGVAVANIKTPKKVAAIKKEFHPERKSFHGYVRFLERESAIKATEINGILYQDHHLRVHLCDAKEKPEEDKAIFVGNLSFYAEEDDLWKIFESCGSISSVRIVRDSKTGIGKGFGYVNFQNSDSVTLALEMENVKLKDRELRIKVCNISAAKKDSKKDKTKMTKSGKQKRQKVKKSSIEDAQTKIDNIQTDITPFQGVKFLSKKKSKINKGLLQKKKKIKQIAPK